MTDAQFLALREAQDGRCVICQRAVEILVPDHDHATGKERALLCRECNLGLGHFQDALGRLRAAIQYLERYV